METKLPTLPRHVSCRKSGKAHDGGVVAILRRALQPDAGFMPVLAAQRSWRGGNGRPFVLVTFKGLVIEVVLKQPRFQRIQTRKCRRAP